MNLIMTQIVQFLFYFKKLTCYNTYFSEANETTTTWCVENIVQRIANKSLHNLWEYAKANIWIILIATPAKFYWKVID